MHLLKKLSPHYQQVNKVLIAMVPKRMF